MNTRIFKAARGPLAKFCALAIVIGALAPAASQVSAASSVYIVNSAASTLCAPVYNGTAYVNPLQSAIDAAIASHHKATILVCPGSYNAVVITEANGLTIKAKDPLNRPHIYAPAQTYGTVVSVSDSTGVVLDGLTIDGGTFLAASSSFKVGISYSNSSGTIQNNVVWNIRETNISSGAEYAIFVADSDMNGKTSSVSIKNNLIAHYANAGILASGAVKATITGNQLDGADGDTTHGTPDVGIWLASGTSGKASGSISKNLVNYNVIGIRTGDVSSISITGNLIQNATNAGLLISTVCPLAGTGGSKNKVSGNTFTDVAQGVHVDAQKINGPSTLCDAHADKNIISKNTFIAAGLSSPDAIQLSIMQSGTPYIATAAGNSISGNYAWGFTNFLTEIGATGTKLSKNTLVRP